MRVRVLFFGILKELAGKGNDLIDMPEGSAVSDVLEHYESQIPRLKEVVPSLALAVNQQYARTDTKLRPNDEVGFLPPVSGGKDGAKTRMESAHCAIVRAPIDTQQALRRIKRGDDGAAVVFEGVVRNQTRARKTLYLDYEAYEGMALREMETLAESALKEFRIRDVAMVHRLGRLEIGETSVLIVVVSAHRAAAFDACRYLIDTLKRTVPIWKKEYFADGAVWADGEPFPAEIPRAQGSPESDLASK